MDIGTSWPTAGLHGGSILKQRHWLDFAEFASLVGLGVGSIVSFFTTLSAQFLYTSAPLSALVLLNIANRKRLEEQQNRNTSTAIAELDHKLTRHLALLTHQVHSLPTVETVSSLRRSLLLKNREVLEHLSSDLANVQQDLQQRIEAIEQQNLRSLRPEMRQMREQYAHLFDSVAQVSYQLQRMTNSNRIEHLDAAIAQTRDQVNQIQAHLQELNSTTKPTLSLLQDQIASVHRQFQKLPPPVDATSLKQEVGELVRIVADLAPKRELSSLTRQVRDLHQQQDHQRQTIAAIEAAAIEFRQHLSDLPQALDVADPKPTMNIHAQVQMLVSSYLAHLRSQLTSVQEATQLLMQQRSVDSQPSAPPLDAIALQRQIQRNLSTDMTLLKKQIRRLLNQQFQSVNAQLQFHAPGYRLVADVPTVGDAGSRSILEQAIAQAQHRLILIFPWSKPELDSQIVERLEAFLLRGGRLDLGWCHQSDREDPRLLTPLVRGWSAAGLRPELQATLDRLLALKRQHGDRLRFQILGTAENFLVCDRAFAALGIAEALAMQTILGELQLKLCTTDRAVIEQLISRFEQPHLSSDDLPAYWNRAVTRADLGDKAGAIADYTHVLHRQPHDAITLNHRGVVRYDLGDREGALSDFHLSLQHDPQQIAPYCNRAWLHVEAGNFTEAIADYTRSIQVQPSAIAYFYRGLAYQQQQDFRRALSDFDAAVCLAPTVAAAYYYRGTTHQQFGNHDRAIADLEIAADGFVDRGQKSNAQKAVRAWRRSQRVLGASDRMSEIRG
ncbi:tetratricopeptide repeat protein [Microcoleus sp. FACHB-1515]|uniref:tetratricopeptide repeat protein n=1 Tax=Cyanophyceae TaxID=3028117 RepID=UPI001686D96E|nr:tetratricopeptide repeat protein [Microcoleus sp. FACHB-1515]MBD2090229.1 tetratricopeptide repeat protein [Microcoleus sp. FACHB-1515]